MLIFPEEIFFEIRMTGRNHVFGLRFLTLPVIWSEVIWVELIWKLGGTLVVRLGGIRFGKIGRNPRHRSQFGKLGGILVTARHPGHARLNVQSYDQTLPPLY